MGGLLLLLKTFEQVAQCSWVLITGSSEG